ncbi:Gfo/Idh/MocA family oxidoreductase [Nitrospinae bacterium AH_259_B05_G02_I21]|nr:Gfo/Idh/MocA family oxidoreductase [Nitrospinae bacterium AH_259_B05_G02_I21]
MSLRAGIVGCGRIAGGFEDDPNREHPYTHIGAYQAVDGVEVVAAADIDLAAREAFRQRWQLSLVYPDHRSMLEAEELDIVSVCTPPSSHAEIVYDAAEAGVKAIFCEKPMAESLEEGRRMVEVCRARGVVLVVNHVRRWDAAYQKAKDLLADGAIGELLSVTGHYTSGLMVCGTHLLDLLLYIVGPVAKVYGTVHELAEGQTYPATRYSENFSVTDPPVSGWLTFVNGIEGVVFGTARSEQIILDLDFQGTRGRLRIGLDGHPFELYMAEGPWRSKETYRRRIVKLPRTRNNRIVVALADLLASLTLGGQPRCSGQDAYATLELSLALHQSAKTGEPLSLPLSAGAGVR